jgi:pimeloyl-ACP methyl ester carboxylesterase
MNIHSIRKLLAILTLMIFISACSGPTAISPVAGTPTVSLPTPTASSPPGPSIHLEPCQLGSREAQCGTLKVYENRTARSGRMIDLRVAIIKAQSDHPAPDPIFYLAGGPGDAATEDATRQQFPYSLSENHDLVFVDQRGTGGSNRVLVPTDSPDLTGLTPEEMDAKIKALVAKFLSEIDMDSQYYTTSVAMDDLDEVRQALGYDKINLFGYSYGATAAQYYLRQHEEHVRTVTLGGGSLLDIPVFERWAHNSQQALDRVFDLCQADDACHTAFPNLREEFTSLLARLAVQPATDSFTSPTDRQPETITYTPDYLAPVIRKMTKDAENDRSLPLLIHRAYQDNNWQGFTQFILANGNYEWWGPQIMERVIRCSEKWAAFNPDEVAGLSEGSYLKGFDLWLAQNQAANCQYTPPGVTPEGTSPQPGSQVPVLILNGEMDPIDPPDNMADAEALWPNSIALALPYQGHSLSDVNAIMCMWSIENEFIQTGSTEGLHTDCLKNIQPAGFITTR